jgi:hypothetical protein
MPTIMEMPETLWLVMHALFALIMVPFLRKQPVMLLVHLLLLSQELLRRLLIARAQLTSGGGTLPSLTIPNHPPVPENVRLVLTVLSL